MPTPIRFKGIVGTTAQIATDRFAGRQAFDTTLARFVVYFDATNYATMARRDVLETFAAGIQDSTLTAGRVICAGTSGRLTDSTGLTFSGGNLNINAGALQTAGVTRISSGGAGAFTTLSTTGLATLVQAAVSDISQDRVVTTLAFGRLQGDTGLSVTRTSGVTKVLTLGDSATAGTSGLVINAPTGDASTVAFWAAGTSRWGLSRIATTIDFAVIARDAGATEIDRPISIVNASAGLITIGGSTNRPVNFTGAIQTSGVTRISSGGDGTLTTLSTTGLATLAQATVSDLTTGRIVTTTTGGRLQTLTNSASLALIGSTFASLFTGRRTVTGLTNGVTGTLIPTYTFAANTWTTGEEAVVRFSLFSTRDGQVEMKLGGNTVSSINLPSTVRCMIELILTCQSAGASARFAYATRISYPGTSGTPIDEVVFGDSQASADGIGDGWTVDSTASMNLTFDYTPSTGSGNPVLHAGTIRTSTP